MGLGADDAFRSFREKSRAVFQGVAHRRFRPRVEKSRKIRGLGLSRKLSRPHSESEAGKEKIVWHTIVAGVNKIEEMEWLCMEFPHHHLHSTGFRYKDMALITDYEAIPEKNIPSLQDLKLLIIECNNGLQQVQNGHSNWYLIKSYLERINPQRVILTHLSPKVDIEIFGKELPNNVTLAYDGMVIDY